MVRIFEKTGIRKHRNSKTWNFEYFGPQNLVGSIFIVFKRHDLTQNEFFSSLELNWYLYTFKF